MNRWKVRSQEFSNGKKYPQGAGMTYDDIVVECADDEEIFAIDREYTSSGFNYLSPVLRAWIRMPVREHGHI